MIQLMIGHSLILVPDQAVVVSLCLLLGLLSQVLVQMRIATRRLQELLLLRSRTATRRKVVLHGHSALAHRGNGPGRLVNLVLRLLWQHHRLVSIVNITLRVLVLLLDMPRMLFGGLKLTLIHWRNTLRLHEALALLWCLRHPADEVVVVLHGLLWILAVAQIERRIVVRHVIGRHLLRLHVTLRKLLILLLLLLLHQAELVV